MTTLDRVQMLHAATPEEEIQWRPLRKDGPPTLPYIDARYVMDVLDSAVGPGDWQDRFEEVPGGVRCGIGILIGDEWIWKYDVGTPSDMESTKGAYSDALKRAGVKWGIARDLYEDGPKRRHAPAQNGQRTYTGHRDGNPGAASARPATAPRPAPSTVYPIGSSAQDAPVAAPGRSSTDLPAEPDLDWDALSTKKPEPFGAVAVATRDVDGTMSTKELLDRADSGSVPHKVLAETSKKLYGANAWKLTELTDVQRYAIAAEVGLV